MQFSCSIYIKSYFSSASNKDKASSNCVTSDELTYLRTVYYLHTGTAGVASREECFTAIC